MKKIILVSFAIFLITLLIGCSGSDGPSIKRGKCSFPPTVKCLENNVQGNEFTLKFKNTLDYSIKITNEQFSLKGCTQANLISVNGDETLSPIIQQDEEFTVIVRCTESLKSLGEAELKFLYESQDTKIKHGLTGVVSS